MAKYEDVRVILDFLERLLRVGRICSLTAGIGEIETCQRPALIGQEPSVAGGPTATLLRVSTQLQACVSRRFSRITRALLGPTPNSIPNGSHYFSFFNTAMAFA
jgi:hypothetical protein